MKAKIITTLFLIVIFQSAIYSQKENYNIIVMGVPQYVLMNGMRVDIDKNLGGSNRWLVFSPQLYIARYPAINNVSFREHDILEVEGIGLGVSYKYMFSPLSNAQGVYLSGGASYNYFDIRTEGLMWVEEFEGSATLIQQDGIFNTQINKMGIHALIGYQKKLSSEFFIDPYIGFGIRLSLDKTPNNSISDLSTYAGDYGFSGIGLVAGIRFGLGF